MNGISKLKGKKIIIIGCSGSGKSYFARELHQITKIPLYYLDCIYWHENWVGTPKDEFIKKINEIMVNDEWIIDGNYNGTLEYRIEKADTIFFLDIDENICIESEKERRGKKRDDLPDYLVEEYDPEFIDYIRNFKSNGRVKIMDLLKKYNNKEIIVFKTREEKNEYLKK